MFKYNFKSLNNYHFNNVLQKLLFLSYDKLLGNIEEIYKLCIINKILKQNNLHCAIFFFFFL